MKRIEQVPWPLQEAINHGLSILTWYENYTGDEIPHENLWDDAEAIDNHFKAVRQRKEDERNGHRSGGGDDDDDGDMMDNDLASVWQ